MLILITALLLFLTALLLVILRFARPEFRFAWLIAMGGTFAAWISVLLWQSQMPLAIMLPSWKPTNLFLASPTFSADGLSWPYAIGLVTLVVAILLTSPVREGFPNSLSWAVSLTLCGLGVLAVTADNPLTLILIWAALDLIEVAAVLRSLNQRTAIERAVITFSVRAAGIVLVLLADVLSSAAGKTVNLSSMSPQSGLLLLAAAGLRLGVLPVYLPYASESSLRRGVGTTLRLASAASSLAVLAHIPTASLASPLVLLLMIFSVIAALYGGWMWMRAPDELTGRPFWMVGLAGLAVASSLRGNPVAATAWGATLILAGGALFLATVQQVWLNRALLVGAWALSSLPLSMTAASWQDNAGVLDLFLPALIVAQSLLIAGFVRHALRPSTRPLLVSQPVWAKIVYPAGVGFLLLIQLLLGLWGWDGAFQVGAWAAGIATSLLTLGLLWAMPRFPALNPVRAHWLQPASVSRLDQLYQNLWTIYRWLERASQIVTDILEGEGGIMWTLLFLILFISLIVQRKP